MSAHRPPPMSTPSALLALASVSLLCGCFTPRATRDVQTWLLYVREVPVAHVVVDGASTGNVVDVSVRGNTAAVTLRHRGQASLVPVPDAHPPGLELAFKEDLRQPAPAPPRAPANLRRLLSERKYDDIQRALDEAASTKRDDLAMELPGAGPGHGAAPGGRGRAGAPPSGPAGGRGDFGPRGRRRAAGGAVAHRAQDAAHPAGEVYPGGARPEDEGAPRPQARRHRHEGCAADGTPSPGWRSRRLLPSASLPVRQGAHPAEQCPPPPRE